MVSGGARTTGRSPEIGGRTMSRDAGSWRRLSHRNPEECTIPAWPSGAKNPTEDELTTWNRLWTQPQSVIWEEQQLGDTVCAYVRAHLSFLNAPNRLSSNMGTLAKQLREELLLSPAALRAARVAIEGSPEAMALDSITGAAANAYDPNTDNGDAIRARFAPLRSVPETPAVNE